MIPILSRINPIPRIDTDLFKVHSNIASTAKAFARGQNKLICTRSKDATYVYSPLIEKDPC